MSETAIFKGNSLVTGDMFAKLQELTKHANKSSGGGGVPRISLKGGKFRKIMSGQQMEVSRAAEMNIVIVGVAPISRTYYAGQYDPENPAPPTCWSQDSNTKQPAPEVGEGRQSDSCDSCPMNVKGSGQGQSRACRFGIRLAVVIENDWKTVYQLSLSAMSIFGDGAGQHMPFNKYSKFLSDNGAKIFGIVTEMAFDENSDVPKVFFKPVRPLEEDELTAIASVNTNAIETAIKLTVAQADGVQAIPAPKVEAKVADSVEDDGSDEIFAEPKKVASKSKAKPAPKEADWDSVVDEWDD